MNVLIVCSGNTCRSPMAEAIAQNLLGDTAAVQSAGMETADGISATKEAITVMQEMGFDISNHRSREIEHLDLAEFDRIIAMSPRIASHLQKLGVESAKITVIDVLDPYRKGIEVYRSTAKALESKLKSLFSGGF